MGWAALTAAQAHNGQLDKAGMPYLLHPMRVGLRGETPQEMVIGFLHDVIEDCDVLWKSHINTEMTSVFMWNAPEMWASLMAITHEPVNEPNRVYIARCAADPVARKVKIYDIIDNSAPERFAILEERDRERLRKKYGVALAVLSFAASESARGLTHTQADFEKEYREREREFDAGLALVASPVGGSWNPGGA